MAKNKVFDEGNHLSYPVGAGCLSGDPVRIGSLNGVAITDGAVTNSWGYASNVNQSTSGNTVNWASIDQTGVWRISTVLTGTRPEGTPIYAIANGTSSVKKVTLTDVASGNKLWGHLVKPGTTGTADRFVRVLATSE